MGITKIAIDTNIFINVKEEEEPFFVYSSKILDAIEYGQLKGVISIITVLELCVGYYNVNNHKEKEEYISKLYSQDNYLIVNLERSLADQSAKIRSEIKLKLPDCIIVATALQEKASFLISNDDRFDRAKKIIKICTSEDFCNNYLSSKE